MADAWRVRPDWLFSSAAGTSLDLSHVSKAFGLTLDKAELIVAALPDAPYWWAWSTCPECRDRRWTG